MSIIWFALNFMTSMTLSLSAWQQTKIYYKNIDTSREKLLKTWQIVNKYFLDRIFRSLILSRSGYQLATPESTIAPAYNMWFSDYLVNTWL